MLCLETLVGVNNSVFIIAAPGGVGKTSLTHKVIADCQVRHCVRIDITSHAGATSEAFYYLEHMAEKIAEYCKDNLQSRSVKKFLEKKKLISRSFKSAVVADGKSIAQKLYIPTDSLSAVINALRNYPHDIKELGLSIQEASLPLDYLMFVLSDDYFVIVLENSQHIDVRSYEALLRLLRARKPHKWILEYTTGKGIIPSIDLDNLIEDLENIGADVTYSILKKLDAEYAERLIFPASKDRNKILELYLKSEGNLRSLKDYSRYIRECPALC